MTNQMWVNLGDTQQSAAARLIQKDMNRFKHLEGCNIKKKSSLTWFSSTAATQTSAEK